MEENMQKDKCGSDCKNCSKSADCAIKKEKLNEHSHIGKVIGIISGKGGVGKSTVTAMLARKLAGLGYKTGIMDADITGPSIPHMFGITGPLCGEDGHIIPPESEEGIKIMSMNLFLDDGEQPVIYRGPVISSFVKQFWHDVMWGDLDFLLIDMPPGTGDVPLTVYQSIPVDGVVLVTSPQNLVKMIVMKAANMALKMDVPLLGIIENYSYFVCPECNAKHNIYGVSGIDNIARELGTGIVARIPIMAEIADNADKGIMCGDFDMDLSSLLA